MSKHLTLSSVTGESSSANAGQYATSIVNLYWSGFPCKWRRFVWAF